MKELFSKFLLLAEMALSVSEPQKYLEFIPELETFGPQHSLKINLFLSMTGNKLSKAQLTDQWSEF